MSKKQIKELFDAAVLQYASSFKINGIDDNFCRQIYMLMWKEFPHVITLTTDGLYLNTDIDNYLSNDADEYSNDRNPHFCTFEDICVQHTLANIIETFAKNIIVYRNEDYPIIIGDHLIIMMHLSEKTSDIYIFQNKEYLTNELKDCIIENYNNDDAEYSYICSDMGNVDEVSLTVKPEDIENVDLEKNYNDDLPHQEITDFLKSKDSGMVILHGEPGTGKSAYMKYLINEVRGRQFVVIDSDSLEDISITTLAQVFLNNKDAVLIIEDNATEKNKVNKIDQIKSLLNIGNGVLGSNISFKIISIFNDSAYSYNKNKIQSSKIKIDYEFKELTTEKTAILCKEYDIDITEGTTLPLSKIIGGDNTDEYEQTVNKHHKIGF